MGWQLNGVSVDVHDWRYRANSLQIALRVGVHEDRFEDVRLLADSAGDYSTLIDDAGVVRVIDQDVSPDPVRVTPPDAFQPTLVEDEFAVQSYTESPADDAALRYDVSLSLARTRTRDPEDGGGERYGHVRYGYGADESGLLSESPGSSDWVFDFAFGDLAVDKGDVSGGEQRARTASFELHLSPGQAEVLLETLGTIGTVKKVRVDGGEDYYVDNHPRGRNTVRISPPSSGSADDYLPAGRYAVTDWEVRVGPNPSVLHARLAVALLEARPESGTYGGSRYGYSNYGES